MNKKQQFFTHVKKTQTCWLWIGGSRCGYGIFQGEGAHRYSYKIHNGEIPIKKLVCHSCDIRNCVNPKHLWIGTYTENMIDASVKGRLKNKKASAKAKRILELSKKFPASYIWRNFGYPKSTLYGILKQVQRDFINKGDTRNGTERNQA